MAHPIAPQQQAQGQARSNNVAPHKLIPRVHESPRSTHRFQFSSIERKIERPRFSPSIIASHSSAPPFPSIASSTKRYNIIRVSSEKKSDGAREREWFSTTRSNYGDIGLHRVSHVTQVYAPRRVCAFVSVNWCESGRCNDDARRSSCPMPLIDFTGRKRASALRLIGN